MKDFVGKPEVKKHGTFTRLMREMPVYGCQARCRITINQLWTRMHGAPLHKAPTHPEIELF